MLVDQQESLRAALADIGDLDPVAVDVERADWDRYWRCAALIQVGGDGRVVLVDPLTIDDLGELHDYLSERLVVLHAMENDLGPLETIGVKPPNVADTAVAAGLLGLPTGLEALLEELLGISLETDKQAMQRADWEARPLDTEMLEYAAADVTDLPELWLELRARLVEQGRLEWYEQELAALRAMPPVEDRRHWTRVKGVGRLDPKGQGRAKALWEIREHLAQDTDTAPGRIVSDKVLVKVAESPPASTKELPRMGMRRQAVRQFGDAIIDALAHAQAEIRVPRERRVTDDDRQASEALREIRAERARELDLDPGLLCPSRTLMGAVMADPATPDELHKALGLRTWQWELLGDAFCEALGIGAEGNDEDADTPGTPHQAPHEEGAGQESI